MFRVPSNADNPTYQDAFKVGFFRWLTSSRAERVEWARRRNAATKASTDAKLDLLDTQLAEHMAAHAVRMAQLEAERMAGGSERSKAAKARLMRRYGRRRYVRH